MPKVSAASVSANSLSPGKRADTCDQVAKPEGKRIVRWRTFLYASRNAVSSFLGLDNIFIQMLAFLVSRVSIMGELSPFGLAFTTVMIHTGGRKQWKTAIWAIGGVMSAGRYMEALLYAIVITIFLRYYRQQSWGRAKKWATSLFISTTATLGATIMALWQQEALYHLVLAFLNGALILIAIQIFFYGAAAFFPVKGTKASANDTYLCGMTVLALAVAGVGEISLWGYSIRNVAGSLFTLLMALTGGAGAGAVAGVAIGLVTGISNGAAGAAIAYYAVAGILAGMLRPWGKYAVTAGFILGSAIVVMYLGHNSHELHTIMETGAAAIITAAIPGSRLIFLQNLYQADHQHQEPSASPIKPAADKLHQLADMFRDMSAGLGHISATAKEKLHEEKTTQLLSIVGKQVCETCRCRTACWETNFYRTYQSMLDSFAVAVAFKLNRENLCGGLGDSCLNRDKLVEIINLMAEKSKIQDDWQRNLFRVRQMVAEQLQATSTILGNLSQEITKEPATGMNIAESIKQQCALLGCQVSTVTAENVGNRTVVEVTKKPCEGAKDCIRSILPVTAYLTQEKMQLQAQCGTGSKPLCRIVLQAAERFQVETGTAFAAKDDHISGDTCAIAPLHKGKVALILSDGMGSGKLAAAESAMTVKFLERLLAAEFDVDTAVRTVNSMLMLRTPDESFATVDMAIIDTYTGEAEFLKIGSAPSFIKRVREVRTVQSATLPIGILHQIEIEPIRLTLTQGDIVVMVSDGVADAVTRGVEKEWWIANFLRRLHSSEPQVIADRILKEAQDLAGATRRDDMTVLVMRLQETSQQT